MEKIPARIVAKVYHDPSSNPEYPWFYTVDAYSLTHPNDEPAVIDYGSLKTEKLARLTVEWILDNREKCENPEFYHVPRRLLMAAETLGT